MGGRPAHDELIPERGEARRPIGGLPTAGPRRFPPGAPLGVIFLKASTQYGFSAILSGRVGPFQRAKKLGAYLLSSSDLEIPLSS